MADLLMSFAARCTPIYAKSWFCQNGQEDSSLPISPSNPTATCLLGKPLSYGSMGGEEQIV